VERVTREIRVVRESFLQSETLDTAVSRAILDEVSEGQAPETLRLHRPGPLVAFGSQDRVSRGYAEAVAAARAQGFGAVQRLAGGRAAVFHEGTIAFAWARPEHDPKSGVLPRFEEITGIMAAALRSLGLDARIGEVPGEYCPGAYSVNAGGRRKLMGVGQRLAPAAAHVGGVVVVADAPRIRDVLVPVYRAMDLEWDPSTVGSVEQEDPSLRWDAVADAILADFGGRYLLRDGRLEAKTVQRARAGEDRFRPVV
jgi:lipoate-protein ligase A